MWSFSDRNRGTLGFCIRGMLYQDLVFILVLVLFRGRHFVLILGICSVVFLTLGKRGFVLLIYWGIKF